MTSSWRPHNAIRMQILRLSRCWMVSRILIASLHSDYRAGKNKRYWCPAGSSCKWVSNFPPLGSWNLLLPGASQSQKFGRPFIDGFNDYTVALSLLSDPSAARKAAVPKQTDGEAIPGLENGSLRWHARKYIRMYIQRKQRGTRLTQALCAGVYRFLTISLPVCLAPRLIALAVLPVRRRRPPPVPGLPSRIPRS